MASPMCFALASETSDLPYGRVARIARAVELQIADHVGPVWGVEATVTPYRRIDDAPDHACPVLVSDRFDFPSHGVHLDFGMRPLALIKPGDDVSVAISHEILEILVDSNGERTVAAPSVKPGQGPVEYLVEICDPPEHESYEHDGVDVSDFCTPYYYEALPRPGVAYSHTRAITRPLEVLYKGYLSWRDPADGVWWQQRRFDGDDGFTRLGPLDATGTGLRPLIDHRTVRPDAQPTRLSAVARARWRRSGYWGPSGRSTRARSLREFLDALRREDGYPPPAPTTGRSRARRA
jgi:hypothetical protein